MRGVWLAPACGLAALVAVAACGDDDLSEGELHGYAIMRRVEERTDGGTSLHPGTLYRALSRLVDTGLLQEIDRAPDDDDERRRYYAMTALGRRVGAAESERLASQLEAARTARFFNPGTES